MQLSVSRPAFLTHQARALVLEQSPHPSPLHGSQMNGTRPGTASSKLSPWDKSSHSAHRVDLSPV